MTLQRVQDYAFKMNVGGGLKYETPGDKNFTAALPQISPNQSRFRNKNLPTHSKVSRKKDIRMDDFLIFIMLKASV